MLAFCYSDYSCSIADCRFDQRRFHRLLDALWFGEPVVCFARQWPNPARSKSAAVHVCEELHGIQPFDLLLLQPELQKGGKATAVAVPAL